MNPEGSPENSHTKETLKARIMNGLRRLIFKLFKQKNKPDRESTVGAGKHINFVPPPPKKKKKKKTNHEIPSQMTMMKINIGYKTDQICRNSIARIVVLVDDRFTMID